jgi:hypothetical protein
MLGHIVDVLESWTLGLLGVGASVLQRDTFISFDRTQNSVAAMLALHLAQGAWVISGKAILPTCVVSCGATDVNFSPIRL